ncbi:MAG: HpcH/HpaI aldolase/citrate lyase family protein [Candidatus Omnitrophota bacterium]
METMENTQFLDRSVLITPGMKPERFYKGAESGMDVTILDFEDSVPPDVKDVARKTVLDFLSQKRENDVVFGIRINQIDIEDGIKDLAALLDSRAMPDVIMIGKVESASQIHIIDKLLGKKWSRIQLYPIIETAKGLIHAPEIATASPRVKALVFGSADFAQDMGGTMGWESLYHARAGIVTAAAQAKIGAIDTPDFNIDDLDGLNLECTRVKRMGFTGKVTIHIKQTEIVNRVFSPSPEEIAWAQTILEAREKSSDSICVVNGKMVGPPMYHSARQTLNIARKAKLLN